MTKNNVAHQYVIKRVILHSLNSFIIVAFGSYSSLHFGHGPHFKEKQQQSPKFLLRFEYRGSNRRYIHVTSI